MPCEPDRKRLNGGCGAAQADRDLRAQAVRFVVTGGINTAFSYAVYAAAIYLSAGYAVASAVSLGAGVLFSYQTVRRLVFRTHGSLIRYAGCWAIIYVFNVMLLRLIDSFGVDPYVCGLLAAVPTSILSFALLKTLVFPTVRSD